MGIVTLEDCIGYGKKRRLSNSELFMNCGFKEADVQNPNGIAQRSVVELSSIW